MKHLDQTYIVELLDKAANLPKLSGTPISSTPRSGYLIETLDGYRVRSYNLNGRGVVEVLSNAPFNHNDIHTLLFNNASDEFESGIESAWVDVKKMQGWVKDHAGTALELYFNKAFIYDALGAAIFSRYLSEDFEENDDFEHG